MSHLNDPDLQALFEQQPEVSPSQAFIDRVVLAAEQRRKRLLFIRIFAFFCLIALEFVFESPISQSLGAIGSAMQSPVFAVDGAWSSFVIEPINSVAGVLGVVLLGVYTLLRRFIRW